MSTKKTKAQPNGDTLITEAELLAMFKAADVGTSLRTVQRALEKFPKICPVEKIPPGETKPVFHFKRVRRDNAEKLVALLKARSIHRGGRAKQGYGGAS